MRTYRVTLTLRDGAVHAFSKRAAKPPRHAASWAMQQLPYGTDVRGMKWTKSVSA